MRTAANAFPTRWTLAMVGALLALGSGCGAPRATAARFNAERQLEAARVAGAAERAPYELALAEAYLAESRERESDNDYEQSIAYAERAAKLAEEAAQKAGPVPVPRQRKEPFRRVQTRPRPTP